MAARLLGRYREGTVTLSRATVAAAEAETPWQPGETTGTTVYTLDAVVKGVTAGQIDGTLILASDLMVVASPKARTASGNAVDVVPLLTDTLTIDGAAKVIKRVETMMAAGSPAAFRLFVAS